MKDKEKQSIKEKFNVIIFNIIILVNFYQTFRNN